jgi:hypothetical protein
MSEEGCCYQRMDDDVKSTDEFREGMSEEE